MATASDLFSGAQDVKRCQLCPEKIRKSAAETVCNTCQVNLCKECVGHHMISDSNIRHDVVTFEFKKSEIIPHQCSIHHEELCELFCEECNSLLCLKCLASGSHEKHTVVQISKIYSSTKALIKRDLDELEADIAPVYDSILSGIDAMSMSIIEKHDERRKTMHDLSKTCHSIVDKVFEKYQRDSIRNERKDSDSIQNLKSDFQKKHSLIRSAIDKNRSILSSNDLSQLVRYTSKNEEFRNIPSRFELTVSSFNPRELTEQYLCQIIGEIPDTKKTLIKGEVLKTNYSFVLKSIHTGENTSISLEVGSNSTDDRLPRAQVACVPDTNQFFVSDNSGILKHMNSEGKLLKEITTPTRSAPADLTVTREGHLVYIDGDDRSINIVKGDKTECLIREKDWIPGAICCTSTDDFLVQLRSEYRVEKPTKRKITRFSGSIVKQEIQLHTKHKKILASHLAFIHENKNLDIILSDMHTESVRVLSSEGQLRFTYDGSPLLMHSKKYGKFIPRGVTTDRKGHILIADSGASIIHIIDQDGQFLLCIDNCGLHKPYGLSIDRNNILFVAELKTKAIKQIKFMLK